MNGKTLASSVLAVAIALLGARISAELIGALVQTIQRDEFNNAVLLPSALLGMAAIFFIPWGIIRILRTRGWFSIPHPENAVGGLALATCLLQGLPELLARPPQGIVFSTAEIWHASPVYSHVSTAVTLIGGVTGALLALVFLKKDRSLVLAAVGVAALIPAQLIFQLIGRHF